MIYPYTHTQQQKHRQTGAVLVMALVLLTVMTLIGVASMTSSSMEMRVASNMQQANIAFQGGQSRVEYILNQATTSANAINVRLALPPGVVPPYQTQTCNPPGCPDSSNWAATAKVFYEGCTRGYGSSLEAGKGIGIRTFEVDVISTAAGGIARSVQAQGVRGVVRGC